MKKGNVDKSRTLMIRTTWCCAPSAANSKLANVGRSRAKAHLLSQASASRRRLRQALSRRDGETNVPEGRWTLARLATLAGSRKPSRTPATPKRKSRANIVWKSVLGQKRTLTRLVITSLRGGTSLRIPSTLSKHDCHPDHNCDCQHAGQR